MCVCVCARACALVPRSPCVLACVLGRVSVLVKVHTASVCGPE